MADKLGPTVLLVYLPATSLWDTAGMPATMQTKQNPPSVTGRSLGKQQNRRPARPRHASQP